jgi:hypothetical protein
MTVLQVLSKMVGTEELLGLVALAKFVHVIQVLGPSVPIRWIRKLFTAISTDVGCSRMGRRCMIGCMYSCQRSAGPRMKTKMK